MGILAYAGGRSLKNLLVISLGWLLFSTAFSSIRFVLTSINHEDGVGYISLAFLYGGYVVACLFAAIPIKLLSCKWCLTLSLLVQLLFLISNMFTSPTIIFVLSAFCGFSQAVMWIALGPYLRWITTQLDTAVFAVYDRNDFVSPSTIFGIFFSLSSMSPILGSVVTAIVLASENTKVEEMHLKENLTAYHKNHTCGAGSAQEFQCGIGFCDSGETELPSLRIPLVTRCILITTFCVCMLVALAAVTFFLDREDSGNSIIKENGKKLRCCRSVASVLSIFCSKKFVSVLLITFYHGIQTAFMTGGITKAYVGCEHGVDKLGYFMMVFGITSMLSSMAVGVFERNLGSPFMFYLASGMNIIGIFGMYEWEMKKHFIWNAILLCGLWGIGDGLWKTTVNSYIAEYFSDRVDEAFSALNLMIGLGMTFSFASGNFMCMKVQLIVNGAICMLGIVLFSLVSDYRKR